MSKNNNQNQCTSDPARKRRRLNATEEKEVNASLNGVQIKLGILNTIYLRLYDQVDEACQRDKESVELSDITSGIAELQQLEPLLHKAIDDAVSLATLASSISRKYIVEKDEQTGDEQPTAHEQSTTEVSAGSKSDTIDQAAGKTDEGPKQSGSAAVLEEQAQVENKLATESTEKDQLKGDQAADLEHEEVSKGEIATESVVKDPPKNDKGAGMVQKEGLESEVPASSTTRPQISSIESVVAEQKELVNGHAAISSVAEKQPSSTDRQDGGNNHGGLISTPPDYDDYIAYLFDKFIVIPDKRILEISPRLRCEEGDRDAKALQFADIIDAVVEEGNLDTVLKFYTEWKNSPK